MTKQIVITPTIGRRIWYVPSTYDRGGCTTKPPSIIEGSSSHPCDAGVVFVHNDRLVNLSVTDHNGNLHKRTSVTLYQPGDTITHADGGYAVWMDYQAQQATPKPQPSTTAKYFSFSHLPAHLQIVSKPLGQLAELLEQLLPSGPELSAGMRKLLEAKDCFVRAALDLQPAELLARAPITDSDRLDLLLRAGCGLDVPDVDQSALYQLMSGADDDLTPAKAIAVLDELIKQERAPQQRTELLDHVTACQSAYHIDSTPGHRFGGLPSNLQENREALVDYVDELLMQFSSVVVSEWPHYLRVDQTPSGAIDIIEGSLPVGSHTLYPIQKHVQATQSAASPMMNGTARQFVEWMHAQPEDREPTTIDGALAEFERKLGITAQDKEGGTL